MHVLRLTFTGATVLLLAACYTAPVRIAALDDARTAVDAARANPQVATYAADELTDAMATYARAESLARSGADADEVRHVSYLARQRAAIALQTARLRNAEHAIAAASAEREQATLQAQEAEAAAARSALLAEARAESAQRAALEAQAHARAPQRQPQPVRPRAQSEAERSAMLAKELRDMAATRSDRGTVVTLNDVLFDPGNATLRPGVRRLLARLGEFLVDYPDRTVAIEGFSDSAAPDASSQELSERRAAAVRAALVEEGVDASRVLVRGYGKAFPVASNDTAEGRQRNRRVEVVISDERGAIAPRVASFAGR